MFLELVNTGHQCIEWSRLTLPSHVKNLPVSLDVVVAITFSMDDTEYSTLIIPSTCQPTEISAAMSLKKDFSRHLKKNHIYSRCDFSRMHCKDSGVATLSLQFRSHVLINITQKYSTLGHVLSYSQHLIQRCLGCSVSCKTGGSTQHLLASR